MKRLFVLLLLLIPSLAFGAFTEFYMQSGGSNLNAGSTNNNTAAYTKANGNWTQSTRVFTVQDGTNPSSSVSVGQFASVYPNGTTVAVYIGRISAVQNANNGTITIDSAAIYGTAPVNQTATATIKVGGAWLGPNNASTFPFGLAGTIGSLVDTGGDPVRVNVKNDQTYSVTVALNLGSLGPATLQGYTTNPNDLGKAIFSSNITTATNFTCTGSASQNFVDMIFVSTGASNSNNLTSSGNNTFWLRCVFHGSRGSGFVASSGGICYLIECEAYDCNNYAYPECYLHANEHPDQYSHGDRDGNIYANFDSDGSANAYSHAKSASLLP